MTYDFKYIFNNMRKYEKLITKFQEKQDWANLFVSHESFSNFLKKTHDTSLEMLETYRKIAIENIEDK